MTLDQLKLLIGQAAEELAERHDRPLPVTIVVPLEGATRVVSLDAFPDTDGDRKEVLSVFAARHMVPDNAPCFGFLAEATGPDGQDLLVAVYGARRRGSYVMAASLQEGLSDFTDAEPLEPTAMPYLQPLQHAVDTATSPEDGGAEGLPIINP